MALEALSSSELLNFIMYDSNITATAAATPFSCNNDSSELELGSCSSMAPRLSHPPAPPETAITAAVQPARKKRRRRPKVCKNKEEAETQRMTHIAVERNRRKQMNEHLAVLRSLMPDSYVQRGDQASIVGGAIEFVKELEHILQSLEAKKFALLEQGNIESTNKDDHHQSSSNNNNNDNNNNNNIDDSKQVLGSPFAQFFAYPQFSCSHNQLGNKYTSQSKASIADIEVTLIETHANIRILSHRRVRQLSKIVASFHSVLLTILHLNVTTLESLVLYSISAKVEEGCQFNSADDIAGAVHHMLRIIEGEAILGCQS
ncbi:transcription factor bhlh96 [Phtheirospermum japonicum]|uniref:Transcription factor bhlh96 n=1 Tax=Phtheirospermum japonicum TaxID=374723 RepID=A0A830D3B1_9LAMI|nr:transcription factor bhlh96 [Phtheirospermum japonicum]